MKPRPETQMTKTPEQAWSAFDAAASEAASARIVDQFAADPERLSRMTTEAAGLHLDLSKQSWTKAAFEACLDLARAVDVEGRRAALFAGEAVNLTEGRAVLHPAMGVLAGLLAVFAGGESGAEPMPSTIVCRSKPTVWALWRATSRTRATTWVEPARLWVGA